MSKRTFFSLRNTVPGYTFILWNLLLNLRFVAFFFLYLMPTVSLSGNVITLFGIILGFVTLLSGAAIGFLVSQFWFLIYWLIIERYLANFYKEKLIEDFEVKDKEASVLVFNYIVHSLRQKRIVSYILRRWDIMTIFGSTIMAIISGLISGLALRNRVFSIQDIPDSHLNWQIIDHILMLVSALLIFAISVSFYYVARSAYDMGILAIRLKAKDLAKEGKELKDELPKEYFKS